jgi:murein DD-endopeptidase MepM/ murein hydrolase activator NlpD
MNDVTNFQSLIEELKQLFHAQQISPPETEEAATASDIQAPIKGTFYNSGGFSFTSPNPRHPNGHMGVDMRAPAGTPVYPMTAGVVTQVGSSAKGGNTVNIQHDNNLRTYYAHMNSARVQKGDRVNNNTIIGTVGDTGNAKGTWPHLHFQVWKDGQIQDPANFFSIPQYTNVDKNKEMWWASNEAKQESKSFNMSQHLSGGRQALAHKIYTLSVMSEAYYQLSKTL